MADDLKSQLDSLVSEIADLKTKGSMDASVSTAVDAAHKHAQDIRDSLNPPVHRFSAGPNTGNAPASDGIVANPAPNVVS